MYFPTDRSETFAFPSLSVVTSVTTLPCSSCTSKTTPSNTFWLSLSTFVTSTFPLSNISFSTVKARDFVMPFSIWKVIGSTNCLYPFGAFTSTNLYVPTDKLVTCACPFLSVVILATTCPAAS